MEADDAPARPDDPLVQLLRQDLDRFSVAELKARVAGLEAEIARSRNRLNRAATDRASADALFRR